MDIFGKKRKAFEKRRDEDKKLMEHQNRQLDEILKLGRRNVELMSHHTTISKKHLEFMRKVGYLTKREMMAMHVLQGLLANGAKGINEVTALAYDYADELIRLSTDQKEMEQE